MKSDLKILEDAERVATYGYAKAKLQHAIKYLEDSYDYENRGEYNHLMFIDGFDTYTLEEAKELWDHGSTALW